MLSDSWIPHDDLRLRALFFLTGRAQTQKLQSVLLDLITQTLQSRHIDIQPEVLIDVDYLVAHSAHEVLVRADVGIEACGLMSILKLG